MKKLLLTLGLLRAILITWVTPASYAVDELLTVTKLNQQVRDNPQHLYDALPKRGTLWHEDATVLAGGAIIYVNNTSAPYSGWWQQSPAANGDTFRLSVVLAPGTYSMDVLGRTFTNHGKIDWRLGGDIIAAGQDWYDGVGGFFVKTVTGIVISEGGRYVLEGTVNGKHTSSTGYLIGLMKIWFHQASD